MKSHGKFRLQLITIKAEGSHENISSLVDYMLIRNSMGRLPRRQLERGGLSLSNPQKVVGRLPYPTSRGRGDVIKIEHPVFSMGFLLVEVKMKPPDIFGGYRHQTTQIFVGCRPYSTSRGRGDVIKIKHPRKTRGI